MLPIIRNISSYIINIKNLIIILFGMAEFYAESTNSRRISQMSGIDMSGIEISGIEISGIEISGIDMSGISSTGLSLNPITKLGFFLAILIYIIGVLAFIFQSFIIGTPLSSNLNNTRNIKIGGNLIMIIISLELILLAIGIFIIHISVDLDDMVGSNLTLYLLPLAGAESAVGLALLIAYYPLRGTISFR